MTTLEDRVEFVRSIPLFASLPESAVEEIAEPGRGDPRRGG